MNADRCILRSQSAPACFDTCSDDCLPDIASLKAEDKRRAEEDALLLPQLEARRQLETYVYWVEERVKEFPHISHEARQKLLTAVEEVQDWSLEDGQTASLNELHERGTQLEGIVVPFLVGHIRGSFSYHRYDDLCL